MIRLVSIIFIMSTVVISIISGQSIDAECGTACAPAPAG
jgi:hypothetical protein